MIRSYRRMNVGCNAAGSRNAPHTLARDGASGFDDYVRRLRTVKGEGSDLMDGILTRFLQNFYLSLTTGFSKR